MHLRFRMLLTAVVVTATAIVAFPGDIQAQDQPYQIRGTVLDRSSENPVPGVQVLLRGTSIGTITDEDGAFQLTSDVDPGSYTVEFSYIGRRTVTRPVELGPQRLVSLGTVYMAESAIALEELVVTGTGAPTARRAIGSTIESIGGEEVNDAPGATTIDQALQGKVTGALISENSGQPGGGVSIRLRGTSSILGGAEPLIVVDGVIIDNSSDALVGLGSNAGRGGAALTNRLADIAPADIERIEVVKGAAAAALYGSRANNGVIQIFTKRGQQGEPRINVRTSLEINETPDTYDLNMAPRATLADVAFGPAAAVGDPVERFDIQDQIFRTGYGSTNHASISGGSGSTTYFLSGNYKTDQGIIETTAYDRKTARAKVTQLLGEKVDVTASANITQSESDFVPEGEQTQGILTTIIFTPTSVDPRFDPNAGRFPFNPVLGANPFVVLNQFNATENVLRFVGSLDVTYRPIERLSLRYLFGYDDYRQESTYLRPPGTESASFLGVVQNPIRVSEQLNHDVTATYELPLSDAMTLTSTAGTRYTSDETNVVRSGASNLPPGQTLVGGATQFASQGVTEFRTFGAFLQEQVNFNDRLYVTGALNAEASSAFGEDERWQLFPKLSGSYIISDAPYWADSPLGDVFSSLRLRAAYGQTGGQPPGLYSRFNNFVDVNFAGRPGLIPSTLRGNPNLKPERQREIEGGFDAGFLDDRVELEFSYYDKLTTDLVLSVPLPPSTGFQAQFQNIGEISNKGVEAALNTINLDRGDVVWRSRLSFSHNENRVEQLVTRADTLRIISGGYPNAVIEGQPIGVFYGGIYARDDQGNLLLDPDNDLPFRAQDTLANGDIVNAARILGDPNPDFTLNFSNTVDVGDNLQFSALLEGRFGNDVANFTKRIAEFFGAAETVEQEVTGEVPPGAFALNPNGRINIYEEYVEDGSFVKLRELALRYRFDQSFAQRIGASGISVRLAARNLYTWTDYSGLDPEVNLFSSQTVARGVDFATTPIPRSFVVGLDFNF